MREDERVLAEALLQGFCCSEAMIKAGLFLRGEENDLLVSAAGGLCSGLHCGCNCGALSGAAVMLAMFDKGHASSVMIPDLVEWFTEVYGDAYDGIDCCDIAGENREYKAERCPDIVMNTYLKCRELLAEADLID